MIGSKVSVFIAKILDFIHNNNHEVIEKTLSITMDKFGYMIANNDIRGVFILLAYSMYNQGL